MFRILLSMGLIAIFVPGIAKSAVKFVDWVIEERRESYKTARDIVRKG